MRTSSVALVLILCFCLLTCAVIFTAQEDPSAANVSGIAVAAAPDTTTASVPTEATAAPPMAITQAAESTVTAGPPATAGGTPAALGGTPTTAAPITTRPTFGEASTTTAAPTTTAAAPTTAAPTTEPATITTEPTAATTTKSTPLATGVPPGDPPATGVPSGAAESTLPADFVVRPFYVAVQPSGTRLLMVYDEPEGEILRRVPPTNLLDEVTTMPLVMPEDTHEVEGWYEVYVRMRPNGATGWVRADEVVLTTVTSAIVIQVGAHRLTLLDEGVEVGSFPICVGTPHNPTPLGTCFVLGFVPHEAGSVYGPVAIATSAMSDVLTDWANGGMVGIHGTNDPSSIGRSVSHGCIRMNNSDIVQVAAVVTVGTPVFILP
jgi:hypothetical protein